MNELKFTGILTHILPVQQGTSKAGKDWKKLQFIVEEEKNQYPQKMVFTMMDADKIDDFLKFKKVGATVEVSFNFDAREYQGKWYGDVKAWNVFSTSKKETSKEERISNAVTIEKNDDDLPF
jgi:hypothetical protein